MKKLILSILSAAGLFASANAQPVVGGQGTLSGVDFFVSLTDPASPFFQPQCGAALIHPQWVVTAGHCVFDPWTTSEVDSIDVVIAPYLANQASSYQRIRSAKVVKHQLFDMSTGNLVHDIALIKLRKPVTSPTIVAMPAQGDNSFNQHGATCFVAGYGVYDTTTPWIQPDTLQLGQIKIVHNDTCNLPAHYGGAIMPGMICAGMLTGAPQGGAAGDSGGPLFVQTANGPLQIGVVSWGQNSWTTAQHPGVYTRIASYRQWIDSVIHADTLTLSIADAQTMKAGVVRKDNKVFLALDAPSQEDLSYAVYTYDGRIISKGNWTKGRNAYNVEAEMPENTLCIINVQGSKGFAFAGKIPVTR